MTQPSFRDLEFLTAYLDGELDAKQTRHLESRLSSDPDLRAALEEVRTTRDLFRRLPQRRVPRNFTLTPKMAGIKPPLPRAYPVLRFATSFAAFLLFLAFSANIIVPLAVRQQNLPAFAAYGIGGGAPDSAPAERPMSGGGCDGCDTAVTEEPLAEAAAPAPQEVEEPAPALEESPATPTEEANAAKIAEEPQPEGVEPRAQPQFSLAPLVIPPLWMGILLVFAVTAGVIALMVRLNSDFKWSRARGAQPGKFSRREISLLAIGLALVFAAAWAIYALAKLEPAPVLDANTGGAGEMAVAEQPLPPGDKGNQPTIDKGNIPTAVPQNFKLNPDMGYGFSYMDNMGQTIAIDFPAGMVSTETEALFTTQIDNIMPQDMAYYTGRGFTLAAFPKDTVPNLPMTITVNYSEIEALGVGDESKFILLWWNGENWVDAINTCSPASAYERLPDENKLRLNVCQFGMYLLAGTW